MERGISRPSQKPPKRSWRSPSPPGNCPGPCRPAGHTGESLVPPPSQVRAILRLAGAVSPSYWVVRFSLLLLASFAHAHVSASLTPRSPVSLTLGLFPRPDSQSRSLLRLFLPGPEICSSCFLLYSKSVSASGLFLLSLPGLHDSPGWETMNVLAARSALRGAPRYPKHSVLANLP